MVDPRLTRGNDSQPEVRPELTNAEGRQVWAHSERPHSPALEQSPPLGRYLEDLLAIAWRWRRRILAGTGIGAALGIVYLLLAQSVYVVRALLHNAGYDVWSWGDRALLRAFAWLHEQAHFPASGEDTWQPHVVNFYYGTHFPAPVPSRPGKNVGWTDWSHTPAAARTTTSPENDFAKR